MKTSFAISTLVLSLACGCGRAGPARPRLSKIAYSNGTEVAFTYSNGRPTAVTIARAPGYPHEFALSHSGGRITSVTHTFGGKVQTASSLSYEGGRLKTVTLTDAAGATLLSLTHSYTEGKLSKTEQSWGQSGVQTTTFSYVGDRLDVQVDEDVLGLIDQTTQHVYDGELLVRSERNGPYPSLLRYSYDEQQRLQKVVGIRTTTYEYVGDLVSKVVTDDGRTSLTATYSYEQGEAEGVIPLVIEFYLTVLLATNHPRFDLAGRMIPLDEPLLTSDVLFLGMD